ncbi:hypothetical protein B0H17DRAFT_1206396 [Mycena rosella]|uniref:Zn(2)-C6 fungal-type domain-containing protein n=1 Tax=Mycena rosella TaxID=1033263 RepID=A0AAD7D5G8_MYCRO|nr:hypothetical protein B0H17DRAFT_1206396 [Mycena rosella]
MSVSNVSDYEREPGDSRSSKEKRTRRMLACSNCRKRKKKCITTDGVRKPCERCTKGNLTCHYISVPVQEEEEEYMGATAPRAGSSSADFLRVRGAAPQLPYTGPPPLNQRPRYSGQPLPDLREPLAPSYTTPSLPASNQARREAPLYSPPSSDPSMFLPFPGHPIPTWGVPPSRSDSNYPYPAAQDTSHRTDTRMFSPPLFNQGYTYDAPAAQSINTRSTKRGHLRLLRNSRSILHITIIFSPGNAATTSRSSFRKSPRRIRIERIQSWGLYRVAQILAE